MPYIAAGTYKAKPESYQWCYSSKGTKAICVRFEILDGDDAGTYINWYGYFSEKTWERTVESLKYMGFKGTDLTELGELQEMVSLEVINEEYNGKNQSKVKWVNSLGAKNILVNSPMPDRDLREFAAAMQSRIDAMQRKPTELKTPQGKVPF